MVHTSAIKRITLRTLAKSNYIKATRSARRSFLHAFLVYSKKNRSPNSVQSSEHLPKVEIPQGLRWPKDEVKGKQTYSH